MPTPHSESSVALQYQQDPSPRHYVQLGEGQATRWTMPWATFTITAFVTVTALQLLTARLVQRRSNALQTYYRTASNEHLAEATRLVNDVNSVDKLTLAAVFVSALAVATWTYFLTRNASERGVPGVPAARTAGLWLVPLFGGAIVMKRLGILVKAFDYSDHRLTQWRYLFYANFVMFSLMYVAVLSGFNAQHDIESASRALDREVLVAYITATIYIASTLIASRAIVHADHAISGRRRQGSAG
jgi:hypothetical protein